MKTKKRYYKTTTLNFKNEDLFVRFKGLCYLQKKTITTVLEELMQEYINKHKNIFN